MATTSGWLRQIARASEDTDAAKTISSDLRAEGFELGTPLPWLQVRTLWLEILSRARASPDGNPASFLWELLPRADVPTASFQEKLGPDCQVILLLEGYPTVGFIYSGPLALELIQKTLEDHVVFPDRYLLSWPSKDWILAVPHVGAGETFVSSLDGAI